METGRGINHLARYLFLPDRPALVGSVSAEGEYLGELPGFDYREDKPPVLRSDPNLPQPDDESPSEAQAEIFRAYRVTEKALTLAQKQKLADLLRSADKIWSKHSYDIGLYNGAKH